MPEIGDFGVVNTGNSFAARVIRWATQSTVNHAFIYTHDHVGHDRILEAEPGGAGYANADKYPNAIWSTGKIPLTDDQRKIIVAAAFNCWGKPYNWLDILAIGLAQRRFGRIIGLKSWIANRLSDDGTLICSQLVDYCYQMAGVELFKDGRPCGMVSPGDLLELING